MQRAILTLLVWIASCVFGSATHCLILISPEAAGPAVRPETYVHDKWIRWAHPHYTTGSNRLLSLTSENDWLINASEFKYRESTNGYRLTSPDLKLHPGYADQGKKIYVYRSRETSVDFGLLSLGTAAGVDIPVISDLNLAGESSTVVVRALSWDSVAKIRNQISGRTIVVEYPPLPGENWSRYWTFGKGWPSGIATSSKIPGLIEARDVWKIMQDVPVEKFRWENSLSFGGANRWLSLASNKLAIRLLCVAFLVIPLLWTAFIVGRELNLKGKELVPVMAIGFVSSSVLIGPVARTLGISAIEIWWVSIVVIISLVSVTLVSKYENGLLIACTALLCLLAFSDSRWSPLSPSLATGHGVFGEHLALLAVLGTMTVRMSILLDGPLWLIPRLVLLYLTAQGFLSHSEWNGGYFSLCLIPLSAWLIGENKQLAPILALNLLNPATLMSLTKVGVVWMPYYLVKTTRDIGGINLFETIAAVSPSENMLILYVIGGILLMSPRFLNYQLSKVRRAAPHLSAGNQIILVLLVSGIFIPSALFSVPWAVGLVGLFWCFEGLRSL